MLGPKERDQLEFFVCGSLRDLVPDDHVLARVDRVLDLSWLRDEVADLYAAGVGRPGIDPEAAVRLMLAGFPLGIIHDRRLMREAQVNLAIRWFAGFGLHDRLPDHSSLTRIRQRWGAGRFRTIFERTVKACVAAGIAKGEDAVAEITGAEVAAVTADAGYAYAKVCAGLERREITAVIPAKSLPRAPIRGRADPQPRADAAVPLRRPARRSEVPPWQEAEAGPPGEARAVPHVPGSGLSRLRPRRALSIEGQGQQGRGPR